MANFEWLETFELGVEEIDMDHRNMLSIMRDVKASIQKDDRALASQELSKLIKASTAHFQREEKLLRQWGYEFVERHAHYHTELLTQVKSIRPVCESIESKVEFEACCEEMMSLLIDDVVKGDIKLKSFLEEKGLRRP